MEVLIFLRLYKSEAPAKENMRLLVIVNWTVELLMDIFFKNDQK